MDPIIATYVIEETGFSEPRGLSLAATMGAHWLNANENDPLLEEWLASGYRKHFRRAKTSVFERLISEVPGVVTFDGKTRLWASTLTRSEDTPKLVKRLQMSNFTLSEAEVDPDSDESPVQVIVNDELGMSFGKAAVAAAHASQNLALLLKAESPQRHDIWREMGYRTVVSRGKFSEDHVFIATVEDFGLTEVAAGSVTAQAFIIDENI